MTAQVPVIRLEEISKAFGEVQANSNITLDIHQGRVLALVGENGAGKSTLMSILAGQLQPDSGTIRLKGAPVAFSNTDKAIASGIGMVYQHFKLVDAMTVAENVFLGKSDGLWLRHGAMNREVAELARSYGMSVRPEAVVGELSMGERQQVEILKLLHRRSSILIFDEPTAVLTPRESEELFATIRRMIEQGKAIVFISHKLEEVRALADDIAILKRGQIIDQLEAAQVTSSADLARRMVGRAVLLEVERPPVEPRQVVLKVSNLRAQGLEQADFELRQGEVLGIVGVAGNGQKPLVETICGLSPPREGHIRILGQEWKRFFSRQAWEQTLSYIPEDRQGLATCQGLSLLDNFLLTTRGGFVRGPWLQRRQAGIKADGLIRDFDIRPPDPEALAWQLSGGNLQKMVLAREFYRKPRLIVAEQPTQGLDIAAAEDVWNLLMKAREQAGILLVTGDLSEALALSDRIGVMYDGTLVSTFSRDDQEQVERIPQMMAGLKDS
ncbi:ABC transporter ATP-binding protein [Desulfogranum mediterraneum]|uniref:ABC transporter ATP-binding protein n=1 Tax=Desulfogranum mediterraneum TaxID=160661 RepID=UPI00041B39D2|nr:ABC transporter ATP-binding protein [Desulfogranum mediterraneum]